MYKKNIEHVAMVSLKYFFDLDYTMFSHAFIVALVLAGLFKLVLGQVVTVFYEGVLSVKEDAIYIKSDLMTLKENWEQSEIRGTLINNLRSLKDLVPQKLS